MHLLILENKEILNLVNKPEKLKFGDISRYLSTEDDSKNVESRFTNDSPLSKHYRWAPISTNVNKNIEESDISSHNNEKIIKMESTDKVSNTLEA